MRFLFALLLLVSASAQTVMLPTLQIGDGPDATGGIGLSVRQDHSTFTRTGQRGISSGPMFSRFATKYVAGFYGQPSFEEGTYHVPLAYGLQLNSFVKPAGVTVGAMYGVHVDAVIGGSENYAVWTEAGRVSFYDTVESRNGGFSSTLGGVTGTASTWNKSILSGTGYYISGNGEKPMVDLSGEWNGYGNPKAIKVSIVRAADAVGGEDARLVDLMLGPTGTETKFAVEDDGTTVVLGDLIAAGAIVPSAGSADWTTGPGSPEGVHAKTPGSLYSRTDAAAGPRFYVKETGSGATGWVAK